MSNILLLEPSTNGHTPLTAQLAECGDWSLSTADSVEKAVALAEAGPVDLIVADLGLIGDEPAELIGQVAPVPVIVTSEREQADGLIDALEAGAVNYIPSHLREDRLVGAIEAALTSASASTRRARLLGWMEASECRFSIPMDRTMLSVAADRMQASLELFGLCDGSQTIHVRIALDEALANAYYHGNLEVSSDLKESETDDFESLAQMRLREYPYCDRRIEIEEHLTRDEARFVIRDDGNGFDVKRVADPTAADRLGRSSGRGIVMMRHFLDEVRFNRKGNEVTLVKRRTVKLPVTPVAHELQLVGAGCE